MECTISPQGNVVDVKVLRGIPLLDGAAVDAVKQWIYTPTLLNGVPVPVIMTVTVKFKLSGGPSSAEAAPKAVAPAPEATGPPEKLADIRRLLELNGSHATSSAFLDAIVWQLRSQARPETPPEFWQALGEELRAERLEDMAVPIYDKHFTHDEIREYIRFYETPAGLKLGATMPVLARESLAAASSRAPALVQKLMERLRASGYLKSAQRP
jgi:TonB family protein